MGSSNKLRQGLAPLPLVTDQNGSPCTSNEQALDRWISFFSEMEGGERVSLEAQRRLWLHNLEQLSSSEFEIDITEVPTLVELERACRQVKAGKASGMDEIPSELLRFCPRVIAKMFYSLMMKICLQGHEPLAHKGGYLVPIWKGKLNKAACQAYRSILISSMVGKTLHKTLRAKQMDLYQRYLHPQQLGGRQGISVVLGGHLIRAFLRVFAARQQPTAILFIDLQEAFYRVVRPLAISGDWSDEVIAAMAERLHLDGNILHDLHQHLKAPSAVESAQLGQVAKRAVQALHTDTFFALHGQADRVRTLHGSRPGDSFADLVFGFLMARVLHEFEEALAEQHIFSEFPSAATIDLHGIAPSGEDNGHEDKLKMLGPCWMDDLAIPLTASSNDALMVNLGVASSSILDLCRSHAMTPNFGKGKTEIVFKPRGSGTQACRKRLFGPSAPGVFTAVGEYDTYSINIVNHYVHLGGLTHFSGDLRREIRRRIAIANQSFNKHRKLIYQNGNLDMQRRIEIFNSLVLSRLLYGAETWCIQEQKTKDYLHSAIVRLYKRLLKCPSDVHISDEEVMHRTGLPSPSTLLRIRRLSYLGALMAAGSSAHWGLLNLDSSWIELLRDDFQWVGDQLSATCCLGDPFSHTARWIEVIRHHRGYWKRLLRRAREHSILVASRQFVCRSAHIRIRDQLIAQDRWEGHVADSIVGHTDAPQFGCMYCSIRCRTFAGEGAHMFKTHGLTHPVRQLIGGTQCEACLTEYFTHGKLKAHLIRAHHCRRQLLGRRINCTPVAGLGSIVDTKLHEDWDGRLPPLKAAGPQAMPVAPREFDIEHMELFETVSILIVEATEESIQDFEQQLRALARRWPISWTLWTRTLQSIQAHVESEDLALNSKVRTEACRYLSLVGQADSWPFLAAQRSQIAHLESLSALEQQFAQAQWREPETAIPRPCCKERIFLHVFSGRRREGDLQFYMEKMFEEICLDGSVLCVVSLDLVIDANFGDVRRSETQRFWLHGVTSGWVVGALCGPPCETWSQARFVEDLSRPGKGPRPLRDRSELWGFASLSLREAQQVAIGNELLLFALELLYALACMAGFGLLEHPQVPDDQQCPSIWHLEVIQMLGRLTGVEMIDLAQGLLGASSPKPTRLLAINLPDLMFHLRQHHVTPDLPKRSAIGRDSDGTWRTAPLKEYPPAMNRALACAFCHWFQRHPCSDHCVDSNFLSLCRSMVVRAFGKVIGHDYGG